MAKLERHVCSGFRAATIRSREVRGPGPYRLKLPKICGLTFTTFQNADFLLGSAVFTFLVLTPCSEVRGR
eukprot:71611-Pleurochrysis_carterae.AAC.1